MQDKKFIDVGKKFGCFTIIKKMGLREFACDDRVIWKIKCDCGYEYIKVNRYITRKMNLYCSKDCKLRINHDQRN